MKYAKADLFPDIQLNGNGGDMYELKPNTNAVYKEFVFDPSDVVTLIRGRHRLHFGGEFLINRADSTAWGNQVAGQFQFNGSTRQRRQAIRQRAWRLLISCWGMRTDGMPSRHRSGVDA